jgi:arylsulfatase
MVAAGIPVPATRPERPPNIVLIMADDLGWRELGCYGQKHIKTPNIDRLAAEGMRFEQFYAGAAVCAPSRCCLMTGKHGGHGFVRDNLELKNPSKDVFGGQAPLPAGETTMAEMLRSKGYATGCFGKWGLGGPGSEGDPLAQGFDTFYGYNCQRHAHNLFPRYLVHDRENEPLPGNTRGQTGQTYAPQRIADEMLKFVRANADRPFLLYYPTVIPHLALQVPDEELKPYLGEWKETPYAGRSYQPHPTPKACYAAMITFLDKQVGRLMATLRELGHDRDTLVIFTSDNGTTHIKAQVDYEFFESVGPLRGLKGSLYEGGIRVPLVARWPEHIPAGTTTDQMGVNYDLLATLAEVVGVAAPAGSDGVSLLPTLLGKPERQSQPECLFWDFGGYGGQVAVRLGKWKGIRRNLRKKPDAPIELYDLDADLGEKNNVAAEHPEVVARIDKIMHEARVEPAVPRFRFGEYGG